MRNPLQLLDRIFHTVTTTDDPVIRKFSKTEGNIYDIDANLATLICCKRSNYSWDILNEKIGGKLFLDKRENTEFGNLFPIIVSDNGCLPLLLSLIVLLIYSSQQADHRPTYTHSEVTEETNCCQKRRVLCKLTSSLLMSL